MVALRTLRAAPVTAPATAPAVGDWDGIAFPQPTPSGVQAWLVLPTRMVPDDADLPARGGDHATAFQLRAARNEYECAQLVLMLAEPVRGASVEFGEFTSPVGQSLPASIARANKVVEVPGIWPGRAASPLAQTWNLVPTTSNRVPDLLLPDKTFDVDRGLTRIWLSLHVPRDAAPGDYTSVIRIRGGGAKNIVEIPLGLRVWSHVLPDDSSLMVLADVRPNADLFKSIDSRPLWEHLRPYYDDLQAHRVNATGEIYPVPAWRRDGPPPDLAVYERALRYVLEHLHFARFRFPGLGLARNGTWEGISIFERPANDRYADARWISGSEFTPSASGPTLAGYSDTLDPSVECEIQGSFSDPVYFWLQVQPTHRQEKKVVRLDGKMIGTCLGTDFEDHPLRFTRLAKPLTIPPGRHTLRIHSENASGPTGDPIRGVFLTTVEHPDLDQLVRDGAILGADFKVAYAYHAKQHAGWLRMHDWLKKAQVSLGDERLVAEVDYGRAAAVYDFVGDLLPSVRRELCAEPGAAMLRQSVEVWTRPLAADPFRPERWRDAIKPVDELWASYPLLHTVGYPAVSMRLLPWLIGRHHFDGYDLGLVDGTLIYPDPRTGDPIDSVRWELFREGLEDLETFRMLRTTLDELQASEDKLEERRSELAEARKLLDETIPSLIHSARDFSWDAPELESARDRAGELLSSLLSPPPATPGSP